jgi:hypothetical protein
MGMKGDKSIEDAVPPLKNSGSLGMVALFSLPSQPVFEVFSAPDPGGLFPSVMGSFLQEKRIKTRHNAPKMERRPAFLIEGAVDDTVVMMFLF